MRTWIQAIDDILRGETTRLTRLRAGPFHVPAGGFTVMIGILGAFYGSCMGWLAIVAREEPAYSQVVASMFKVPALFLLTLVVTFPSLYVFNALVGSRLVALTLFRLLIAALAVSLAVLASFGPIVAFFSLTTTNYPFMVVLNVVVYAIAGFLGLAFLLQTLRRLTLLDEERSREHVSPPADPVPEPAGALAGLGANAGSGCVLGGNVNTVFRCWLLVFGLVGAQMSWVLRPFIGNPSQPFAWFRPRESNFFEAVGRAVLSLLFP